MSHTSNTASHDDGLFPEEFGERLDNLPKGAWIAVMVIAFVLAWPVGLLVLGYLLWSGKMQSWKSEHRCGQGRRRHRRARTTGNTAFDAYRDETLSRLEEERKAFETFLDQLRRAKDQEQFDQFMSAHKTETGQSNQSSV